MLTVTFPTPPPRRCWSVSESARLQHFVIRFQHAVRSREELIALAANYFHRSPGSIRDRLWCLQAPEKQRTSRLYPGQRLRGQFPQYT